VGSSWKKLQEFSSGTFRNIWVQNAVGEIVRTGRESKSAVPFKRPASHSLVKPHEVRRRSNASKAIRPWAEDKEDKILAAQLLVVMLSERHNRIGIVRYPFEKTDAKVDGTSASSRVIVAASCSSATANSRQLMWILSTCFLGRLARRRISGLQM
jgi:hypothetical protein